MLLPVFAGVAGAERLFTITCLVVLVSLAVHGGVIGYYLRRKAPRLQPEMPAVAVPELPVGVPEPEVERISQSEVRRLQERGESVIFVDSRAPRSYDADDRQIPGSIRVPPDDAVRSAISQRLTHQGTLVVYCA